jgi:predicted alpha/beta hydrolase family esterase
MFEKIFSYLKDEVIFVGHSLGWTFLAKYFNEEKTDKLLEKIQKIILVAPAFKDSNNEVLWTFNFDKNLENLKKIQEKLVIFGSKDDFVIPFDDIEDFQKRLKNAEFKIFENKGHFLQEDFRELVEYLKNI